MAPTPTTPPLDVALHVKYIQNLDKKQDLAYHLTEHLRLNGVYWGHTACYIMGTPDALDREEMINYVLRCWDDEAGTFGAHPGHDGHILGTLSGIQILVMQDALNRADTERITKFLLSLVGPQGQVSGDHFGESDSRFSYILVNALSLLGRLDDLDSLYDGKGRQLVLDNILGCMNFDGAFGTEPGAESHGGQVWVCTAALAILGELDKVDRDTLGSWLSERQLPNGGLNGRPEKLEDVCYSWWDLASLSIIERIHWINRDKLIEFILSAQDLEGGGIADRKDDWVDVFHTVFGVAGLSLLGYPGLQDVDPLYCLPAAVTERLGLRKTYAALPRMASYP
ncbi:terpenoid cyclases/protein prenyltransferase alpha-alpha toroid [Papiliotrema laurentii]|uniref:Geranylgeranyl transferase type-2 subunit beta n=1 Tax=Papiliotrema laurentii TaxID=5418 RepID=A0AAD9L6R7_PAPLA|nr:terpenoid cyclases/protein prenyltransferase alpha-alpha toroid [Papiliotrema laurentii]